MGSDRKLFKTIDKHLDQILEDNQLSQSLGQERKQSINSIFGSSALSSQLHFPRRGSTFVEVSERERRSSSSLINFNKSGDFGRLFDNQPSNFSRSMLKENSGTEYLEEESPFGPLKSASTRRTFAYLIAILNITYPDHDFSSLQPTTENFHKIEHTETLLHAFNSLMASLGKKKELLSWIWDTINMYMDILPTSLPLLGAQYDDGLRRNSFANGTAGSPKTEGAMSPVDHCCRIYEFQPSDLSILEDMNFPYQTMWSKYWFIYNKKKKRVCFLYLSALNHMDIANNSRNRSPSQMDPGKLQSDERNDDSDSDYEYIDDVDMDSSQAVDDVIGDIEL